jgi:hypothetical protein
LLPPVGAPKRAVVLATETIARPGGARHPSAPAAISGRAVADTAQEAGAADKEDSMRISVGTILAIIVIIVLLAWLL